MRLSPIVLSAATAWAGQVVGQHHEERRNHQSISYYSGYRPELSTEFFLVPTNMEVDKNDTSVASVVSVPAPNRTISIYRGPLGRSKYGEKVKERRIGPIMGPWLLIRHQAWALPLAALSAAIMLLLAGFETFVLCKARVTAPNRRHLFLGQVLLLGLFFLAGLSAAASLTPNPVSCAAFRLVGLPAALVFAALLVKCVFLLSLNSGVYLPAPYQALVLIFAVLVQVAINGQWFYGEPPTIVPILGPNRHLLGLACETPIKHTLASLGYPSMLLIAVAFLAIRARGIRDNYREAAFIGLAIGLALPIWLSCAIGALAAPEYDQEAWVAYGLLFTSLLIFLTMFLPKGRQLAALGRENSATAAAMRDREEQLSCSSLPGSGYSPSFFHFKPAETSLKRKIDYHSTDRVALVSSGVTRCNACRHGNSPIYSDEIHRVMDSYSVSPGVYLRPEDVGNLYTTLSTNPNVFFQRAHPGMIY